MIFIDTGAFIAKYLKSDQYHKKAQSTWANIESGKQNCFTSNFVLDELFTLLGRWAGHDFAALRARNIYSSNAIAVIRPEESDEIKALEYFEKYRDKQVSFTDCISFVLMKKNRIRSVFAFDRHFTDAGFKLLK